MYGIALFNGSCSLLFVKGQNFVLNMNDTGYTVAVYNRNLSKIQHFLDNEAKGQSSAP